MMIERLNLILVRVFAAAVIAIHNLTKLCVLSAGDPLLWRPFWCAKAGCVYAHPHWSHFSCPQVHWSSQTFGLGSGLV
jgi:hypothetical protein